MEDTASKLIVWKDKVYTIIVQGGGWSGQVHVNMIEHEDDTKHDIMPGILKRNFAKN